MSGFTVANVAEALGVEASEARARLRKAGVEKTDGKYAWKNEKEFKAVIKQLSGKGGEEKSAKAEKAPKNKDKGSAPENKSKGDGKKAKKKKDK